LRRQFEAKGRPKRVNYRAKTSEKSVFLRLTLYPSHWELLHLATTPWGAQGIFQKKLPESCSMKIPVRIEIKFAGEITSTELVHN
jgi:hypothetical protein